MSGRTAAMPKGMLLLSLTGSLLMGTAAAATPASAPLTRPQGSCDIYAAAGAPCVAAHSTTRALYAAYNGPLYQVLRQSDGKTLDIGVVPASASDRGGYADAAAQDRFCAGTTCWIAVLYDQSAMHNDLKQAPRGTFSGPAMGGFNNLPLADSAPVTVMGHKVYGVFIAPGMGLRLNDAKGTAVDDLAEGQYWVINGHHFNSGCCFDYGNAETDSRDDGNGTMETTFFGNTPWWYHGNPPGPWIMTDQENNLVGCVNEDKSKLCSNLPNITWRFVTAMAKGKPHHWTSLGGDAQKGPLSVMFDGPRIDATYDPMRKQGAIVLGNGGDNSVGSQGTFYEGAMTAAGTFPSDATDQKVQANVVAAAYGLPLLTLAPALAATSPGLQSFTPGSTQDVAVTFTNATATPVSGLALSLVVPKGWTAPLAGSAKPSKFFAGPLQPGQSVRATFRVRSGAVPFNGDLTAKAVWKNAADGKARTETAVEKLRNAAPVKINEFRLGGGSGNAFIELYNAGRKAIDLSHWSLTARATETAIFSAVQIPAKTLLAPGGFYVLGLSHSGLAAPAAAGERTIFLRNVAGLKIGDTLTIGSGPDAEQRKISAVGTSASPATTLWQPLPDGPVITIPAGSHSVPVTRTGGFAVGEKIALGYGASYPVIGGSTEQLEIATVTAVGKPGTQAYLGADAPAGATRIEVITTAPVGWPGREMNAIAAISPGDTIRLDIDSPGHGIETVTVKTVGTATGFTTLTADAAAGSAVIKLRRSSGWPEPEKLDFAVGDRLTIGMPGSRETRRIKSVQTEEEDIAVVTLDNALSGAHIAGEDVNRPGTGLELTAPLKFSHAANMPFSVRGTGISFTPASAHPHSSNEPVIALGSGVTLDAPLAKAHGTDAAVYDAAVSIAGFQGRTDQYFGGPVFSPNGGSMVLKDANGLIVDSLNYGLLADPVLAEGYQAVSGLDQAGCFAPAPGANRDWGNAAIIADASAGRFPDGQDSDSNCTDFQAPATTLLAAKSAAGARAVKVEDVRDFAPGQTLVIGTGRTRETAVIAMVGTAGATTATEPAAAGATAIAVAGRNGFSKGQTIIVGDDAQSEEAVLADIHRNGPSHQFVFAAPLKNAHAAGCTVSGTGLTLTGALQQPHEAGAQITTDLPTPGAPNRYSPKPMP